MKTTLTDTPYARRNLAERIHARFAALGALEFPDIPREPMRQSPALANDRGRQSIRPTCQIDSKLME